MLAGASLDRGTAVQTLPALQTSLPKESVFRMSTLTQNCMTLSVLEIAAMLTFPGKPIREIQPGPQSQPQPQYLRATNPF